jgi:uncharacterized protein (DUF305 family)
MSRSDAQKNEHPGAGRASPATREPSPDRQDACPTFLVANGKEQEAMKSKSYLVAILVTVALAIAGALAQHPAGHGAKMADQPYDLHYIDMLIEHHQMGIDMATMAQNKASHAELKDLATKMVGEQQKDQDQLKKWRDEWYAGKPKSDHMKMPGMKMSGMKMPMDMSKLEAASGNDFDVMFLDMIIPHHQMAIDMSKDALKKAQHAQLKTFARTTIDKQQKEKAQLSKWRAAWGKGAPAMKGHMMKP